MKMIECKTLYQFFSEIIKESLLQFKKQYLIYWAVLYCSTALSELSRQIMLEQNVTLKYSSAYYSFFHPLILIPYLGYIFFAFSGFAALYFIFNGMSVREAVTGAIKNFHRYAGLVFIGGATVLTVLILVPVLVSLLFKVIGFVPPTIFVDPYAWVTTFPLLLLCVAPALYLLISFVNAPFILLFEKKGIIRSFIESRKRVRAAFFRSAILLITAFILSAIFYWIFRWIIFSLKLALISDLSFRGETMLKVFIYSIPWVVVASYYDLIVYLLYKKIKPAESAQNVGEEKPAIL